MGPPAPGSQLRRYLPDFIVLLDDGHGDHDLLHMVIEVKGYRGEDAKDKKTTMETLWVPGVNRLGAYGRWAFAELRDVYTMREGFELRSGLHNEFEHVAGEFLEEIRAEAAQSLIRAGGSMPDSGIHPAQKEPDAGMILACLSVWTNDSQNSGVRKGERHEIQDAARSRSGAATG